MAPAGSHEATPTPVVVPRPRLAGATQFDYPCPRECRRIDQMSFDSQCDLDVQAQLSPRPALSRRAGKGTNPLDRYEPVRGGAVLIRPFLPVNRWCAAAVADRRR
jgi:hypothetical protein